MFEGRGDYVPIGCFNCDKLSDRSLPEMLANFRVQSEKWPEVMNWTNIESTVVKKCAAKVRSYFQQSYCLLAAGFEHSV